MTQNLAADLPELGDPIELVARFVVRQDWFLKQTRAGSVLVDVPGQWGNYQLSVDWQDQLQTLCVEATLDLLFDDVPVPRLETLLSDLNSHLFMGISGLTADQRQVQAIACAAFARGGRGYTRTNRRCGGYSAWPCEQAAPAFAQLIAPDQLASSARSW